MTSKNVFYFYILENAELIQAYITNVAGRNIIVEAVIFRRGFIWNSQKDKELRKLQPLTKDIMYFTRQSNRQYNDRCLYWKQVFKTLFNSESSTNFVSEKVDQNLKVHKIQNKFKKKNASVIQDVQNKQTLLTQLQSNKKIHYRNINFFVKKTLDIEVVVERDFLERIP